MGDSGGSVSSVPVKKSRFMDKFDLPDGSKAAMDVFFQDGTEFRLRFVEKVSRLYVRKPRTMFAAVWGGILVVTLITFAAGWFDIAETTFSDWQNPDSRESEFFDALDDAREQLDSANIESGQTVRSEEIDFLAVSFLYQWNDGREEQILGIENLKKICEFQALVTSNEDFPRFCPPETTANGTLTVCSDQAFDIVSKVYTTPQLQNDCPLLDPTDVQNTLTNLALNEPEVFFFFTTKEFNGFSDVLTKTRSQVGIFGPLGPDSDPEGEGFTETLDDDSSRQFDVYEDFLLEVEKSVFAEFGLETTTPFGSAYDIGAFDLGDGLQVRIYNGVWETQEFERLVAWDQLLVSASALATSIAIFLHTRSLFITVCGLFAVLFSIPVALFLYSGVFRILYFNSVHIIVIFLMLGVGANALFVWVDAFYQSEKLWPGVRGIRSSEEALKRNIYGTGDARLEILIARLTFTFTRAAGTVFNTSFTTAAAFFATATSDLVPIAGFGLFAAITVIVNFVWVLILYPSVVIIYDIHFAKKPFCCACIREPIRSDGEDSEVLDVETGSEGTRSSTESTVAADNSGSGGALPTRVVIKLKRKDEPLEEKAFTNGYIPFMMRNTEMNVFGREIRVNYVAWLSAAVFVSLFIGMLTRAIQLDTPTEQDEQFGSGHMFTGFFNEFTEDFKGATDFMEVEMTFGISGVDRSGFKKFDPNGFRGTAVFDDNFDPAPRASQEFFIEVCEDLRTLSCVPADGTEPAPGCISTQGLAVQDVECLIENFHDWHATNYPLETAAIDLGDVNRTRWIERLAEFSKSVNRERYVGIINGELKFLTFKYESTLRVNQPVNVKSPVERILRRFLDDVRESAPQEMETVFQMSFDLLWTQSELAIVEGMFIGLAISLPVAYGVLILATGNLITATLAIVTITSVIVVVLGIAELTGFALSVSIAIAVSMVVGLSVDFPVILGSTLRAAQHEGVHHRRERFAFAAKRSGGTVLAGALTTTISSSFLLLANLFFFTSMGQLIASTMMFSIAFTFFFFMPLMLILGPEGEQGDLYACFPCKSAKNSTLDA